MKIYIAGPMAGLPHRNYPEFFYAEGDLLLLGHTPFNPARHVFGDWHVNYSFAMSWTHLTWSDWMKLALRDMLQCDAILMLPGWRESRGASIEYDLACSLEMKVFHGIDEIRNLTAVA